MNKVVNINLNGIIISIDEVAYEQLKKYIDALHKHFTGTEGAAEIISDIETRIAELLQLKLTDTYTVIQSKDVADVIAIMGNPWEMDEEDEPKSQSQQQQNQQQNYTERKLKRDPQQKVIGGVCGGLGNYFNVDPIFIRGAFLVAMLVFGTGFLLYFILWAIMPLATPNELPQFTGNATRKLYRNPDNKVLGGVCSGVAAYLGIDEIWLRIGFIISVFVFGSGFLAYIILWIIIPQASTAAEKLKMKGSAVDVNNIEREVRSAAHNITQSASKKGSGLNTLIKLAAIIIALVVLFLIVFPGSIVVLLLSFALENGGDFSKLIQALTINQAIFMLCKWGLIAGVLSVVIGFASIALRLFTKFKLRYFSLLSTLLLLGGITLCVLAANKYRKEISFDAVMVDKELEMPCNDTLTITLNDVLLDEDDKKFNIAIDHEDVSWAVQNGNLLFNKPVLHIKPSGNGNMQVRLKQESKGSNIADAEEMAQGTNINLKVESATLVFDNWINIGKNPFKLQEVSVGVWLPIGTIVKVDREVLDYMADFDESDYDDEDFLYNTAAPYQYFRVTDHGLTCLTCDKHDWEFSASTSQNEEDKKSDFTLVETTIDSTSKDGQIKVIKKIKKVGPITVTNIETINKK
jgi:phage shock protein PspC (stress-responsive transcriptional regulator)